ncbi:hypothetical protein L1049_012939 [Liquidambar formosana]|uniref:Peptidase A1 domain-containing protein n=1 Tax=Liquidambar formosana TaxID=63359 RepID=A0AAP0RJF2_LIQFO
MAAASPILCFLSLLSLSSLVSSTTISLPLSHFTRNPSPDPYQNLNHLVSASLTRAHHLKNPQSTTTTTTISTTPLFPHSYGAYSISLSFGTPPQTIPFLMDTGSDLVWFPCTHRYICNNCSFSSTANPPPLNTFIPKSSSSSKIVGCLSPKCGWIHDPDIQSRCSDCASGSSNCTQICPPYLILYGSGSTGGLLLSETLDLPEKHVPEFIVGCSIFSSRQPAGIAGFGRGPPSLPSQLGLKKFSYCLLSRQFDDTSKSSSLVLDGASDSGEKTDGVVYTPFVENPKVAGRRAFSVYYYVGLRRITVGGKRVKVPYRYLTPGIDGSGGTIVDSGTTFTFMSGEVFELVANEFENQVKSYKRAMDVEAKTGLRPCFNASGHETLSLPELRFHFKGGAEMGLPLENYFVIVDNSGAVCMAVVTDGVVGGSGGPAIILGNFQTQNFYVEYDLRNERLGFRRQSCK